MKQINADHELRFLDSNFDSPLNVPKELLAELGDEPAAWGHEIAPMAKKPVYFFVFFPILRTSKLDKMIGSLGFECYCSSSHC